MVCSFTFPLTGEDLGLTRLVREAGTDFPYKKYIVVQGCDMVVARLFTSNILLTTLFPAYDNLVQNGFIFTWL